MPFIRQMCTAHLSLAVHICLPIYTHYVRTAGFRGYLTTAAAYGRAPQNNLHTCAVFGCSCAMIQIRITVFMYNLINEFHINKY